MRSGLLQSHTVIIHQEGAQFCLSENMTFGIIYNTALCIGTNNWELTIEQM